MGMQIPYRVDSQTPAQVLLRKLKKMLGGIVLQAGIKA